MPGFGLVPVWPLKQTGTSQRRGLGDSCVANTQAPQAPNLHLLAPGAINISDIRTALARPNRPRTE